MDEGTQHLGGFLPVLFVIAEAGDGAGLVVVAPEHGVPGASVLHALLPFDEETAQLIEIGIHQSPFLAVLVVHLEVMETEDHLELFFIRIGIAQAVVEGCGRHLADRHIIRDACVAHKFLEILVDAGAVGVEASAVALEIILQDIRLGDQVDHIEAEAGDTFCLPEADDIFEFLADFRVFPVEVRLGHIKEMQVILSK